MSDTFNVLLRRSDDQLAQQNLTEHGVKVTAKNISGYNAQLFRFVDGRYQEYVEGEGWVDSPTDAVTDTDNRFIGSEELREDYTYIVIAKSSKREEIGEGTVFVDNIVIRKNYEALSEFEAVRFNQESDQWETRQADQSWKPVQQLVDWAVNKYGSKENAIKYAVDSLIQEVGLAEAAKQILASITGSGETDDSPTQSEEPVGTAAD